MKVIKTAFRPANRNSIGTATHAARLRASSDATVKGILVCDSYAHQIHSDRNIVAQPVISFSFTVYIPCKPDSSLFYVESWGPCSVYCGEPDSATFFC